MTPRTVARLSIAFAFIAVFFLAAIASKIINDAYKAEKANQCLGQCYAVKHPDRKCQDRCAGREWCPYQWKDPN